MRKLITYTLKELDNIMKILFIGGTGFISTAVSRLVIAKGFELYHLNRGQRKVDIPGVKTIIADIHQPGHVRAALKGLKFDVVVDWIAFTPARRRCTTHIGSIRATRSRRKNCSCRPIAKTNFR
jgi:nucleoside-diphosphate-sugar epimerase